MSLFGNPVYSGDMMYSPQRVWDSDEKQTRLYSEIMTGDLVWDMQVSSQLSSNKSHN